MQRKTIAMIGIFSLVLAGTANAARTDFSDIVLTDGNSSVSFKNYDFTNRAGNLVKVRGYWKDWNMDGADNLSKSKTCFKIGTGDNRVGGNLLTMEVTGQGAFDLNFDGQTDTYSIMRMDRDNGLAVNTVYTLRGGAAGSIESHMNVETTFTNNTDSVMNLSLFQTLDFDLGTTVEYDRSNPGPYMAQAGNEYGVAYSDMAAVQWDETITVSIMNQAVDSWYLGTPMCRGRYFHNNPDAEHLPNNESFGPDDVGWIFEWNIELAANGGTAQINSSYDMAPVPVPASILLLGAGIMGLVGMRKRNRK